MNDDEGAEGVLGRVLALPSGQGEAVGSRLLHVLRVVHVVVGILLVVWLLFWLVIWSSSAPVIGSMVVSLKTHPVHRRARRPIPGA